MPIVETGNPDVLSLEGLHLFHFAMSSCSQRVRMALEEKELEWESHHVDLNKMENVSAWYQAIHPDGYVPALVHDGALVTESTDIIVYVDENFQGPALVSESGGRDADLWLQLAANNQRCLKYLTYELVFRKKGHFANQEDVEFYCANQSNADLVAFMREFSSGFSPELIAQKKNEAMQYLEVLNNALGDRSFLLGDEFSLADMANVVNVHRYRLCSLDMASLLNVVRWYEEIALRPSFKNGIEYWQNA
jgi:glutathione S-transferase